MKNILRQTFNPQEENLLKGIRLDESLESDFNQIILSKYKLFRDESTLLYTPRGRILDSQITKPFDCNYSDYSTAVDELPETHKKSYKAQLKDGLRGWFHDFDVFWEYFVTITFPSLQDLFYSDYGRSIKKEFFVNNRTDIQDRLYELAEEFDKPNLDWFYRREFQQEVIDLINKYISYFDKDEKRLIQEDTWNEIIDTCPLIRTSNLLKAQNYLSVFIDDLYKSLGGSNWKKRATLPFFCVYVMGKQTSGCYHYHLLVGKCKHEHAVFFEALDKLKEKYHFLPNTIKCDVLSPGTTDCVFGYMLKNLDLPSHPKGKSDFNDRYGITNTLFPDNSIKASAPFRK